MTRSDRLFEILRILRDGARHRAADLAARFGVSPRTIYRDMDRLAAAGLPVEGTRGQGYRIAAQPAALPPLRLTEAELEALNLGIAIVAESADPDLRAAARSLGEKIDAALPEDTIAPAEAWLPGPSPFADVARGFALMPLLRSAIRGRQKLDLRFRTADGGGAACVLRPLALENWGRVWALVGWCETTGDFRVIRADLVERAEPLPELFLDEPGRGLGDYRARAGGRGLGARG